MIKIPYEEIISKICEKTSLSKEAVEEKISQKMQKLAGLISKEGAAHIVANELGVKLIEQINGKLKLKNILAGMRNVDTIAQVQKIFETKIFESNGRSGKVASLLIADETAQLRLVIWGEQTNILKGLSEGSIIKILGGYVKENQGKIELHVNDRSRIIANPIGEKIEISKPQQPERKEIKDLSENDQNVEILGTLVQLYDPRFYEVCPLCNKRIKQNEIGFVCESHGQVSPSYSYLLNAIIDDGSQNIRVTFFKNQAEKLLAIPSDALLTIKDSPESFEEIKKKIIGTIVKVVGRSQKNQIFDRLEFISTIVYPNPDPREELNRISNNIPNNKIMTISDNSNNSSLEQNKEIKEDYIEEIIE